MIIGSISENEKIEKRISITPDIVKKYISVGFKIILEKDYGNHLGFQNQEYENEGCELVNKSEILEKSNIILQLIQSLEIITEN